MPKAGVAVRRILPARRERVFEAWTRPELLTRWFFPGSDWKATASTDLRIGGRYDVVMRETNGTEHLQFGVYREIEPVSRLVFTWNCPELSVTDSVVIVELIDRGAQTELVLTHELPPDPKIRQGHEEGWKGCTENLARFLESAAEKEGT